MAAPKFGPLLKAGWEVIPLKREGGKKPLVSGFHGAAHEVADEETVRGWAKTWPDCNPGLTMPPGIIGLDVDNHDADGIDALREFERVNGELPEGPRIFHGFTDEGLPSPYGTRLFRVPEECLDYFGPKMIVGNLNKVSGPGVDVIAPWLRYNVAPGAVHRSGEVYQWAWGDEALSEHPRPEDVPFLTVQQFEALRTGRSSQGVKTIKTVSAPTPENRGTMLLKQTRELAMLAEGETLEIEGQQRGWQMGDGFFVLACALVRAALAAGRDLDVIGAKFVKAAVADGHGLDEADAERQWENALLMVEEDSEFVYDVSILQKPMDFASEYLNRHHRLDGVLTLRYQDMRYWEWCGTHYKVLETDEIAAMCGQHLNGKPEMYVAKVDGVFVREQRLIAWNNKCRGELLPALKERTLVSPKGGGVLLPSIGGVPFLNGWLDIESGELVPLTPDRDVRWVVPGKYDPDAPEPIEWLKFLESIGWTPETQEYRLLRQWYGYLLSGDQKLHKAAMLVGPPRAGKGTILRVAEAMFGEGAVGLDLDAFSTNFGLSPIVGKGLATVDDARFEVKTDKATVRRLLTLVAQGTMSIDRKYKDPLSIRATARLMLATNEIPALIEASDALASRFIFLKFTESFIDREDFGLERRIISELPGIVKWALEGLADLRRVGHFSETDTGLALKREMAEISNPIRLFIEECCEFSEDGWVATDELHEQYVMWAEPRKYHLPSPAIFARDLNAAYPDSVICAKQKRIGSKVRRGFQGLRLGVDR